MKSGYRWRVLACAATLLTFGLAATIYSVEELGMDGHLAPAVALLPPSHMLSYLWEDVTPPLYFWALKAWLWAAGVGFIQTRWLSIACASLAQALLFVIGKRLIGSRAGAATVLLWAA
ncbi:MAG TPA: glycosyltransferase family 39 protein, partial [Chloroflexota bacterium]|nr:glycosyltransferase family 39 protein [Chloroflexota bacterium]